MIFGDFMLTKKQEQFFQLIKNYYKTNNILPNLNTIKKISNYKSYNTIYKYLKILESINYLKYDKDKKEITYLMGCSNKIHTIPFINKKEFIKIEINKLDNFSNYVAFQIDDNNLKKLGIIKGDIVITQKNNTYLNNKFVLVNIKNKYKVFKYQKKDGFTHLINDKDIIPIINNNNIIGKVVLLIRDCI